MENHTPGPWKNNGLSKSGQHHFNIIGSKVGCKYKIARVPFESVEDLTTLSERWEKEAEADANLIAAAPELLEALICMSNHYKRLVDSGDCGCWKPEDEPEYTDAINVINKALGND